MMEELEDLLPFTIEEALENEANLKPVEIQCVNYVQHVRRYGNVCPDASPVSISTVSSIGMISESRVLDLKKLTEELTAAKDVDDDYFIVTIGPNKKKSGSEFGNSVNVKLVGCPDRKVANIILSQNGRMTLTGADCLNYGLICMNRLLEEIKLYPHTFYNVRPETISIESYETTMINTDYSAGFEINQLSLYDILVGEYEYFVTYNPETYPGVSLHYMWRDGKENGICDCTPNCLSRKTNSKNGRGFSENNCREITCAIFHSGNIIISGSNCIEQVNDVYEKLNNLLKIHYEEIVDFSIKNFPCDRIINLD